MNQKIKMQKFGMKAIIIDMSEVLVHTARINQNAWETVFNDLLNKNNVMQPFTIEDYNTFIEGKPKFERVQNFLNSQNINLPFGSQSESTEKDTICSLEKRKSKIFSHLLKENELQFYEKALEKIKYWKEKGLKTAIVSSDETFKKSLNASVINNLFDVKIDGHASRKKGLKEKPEADLYIEATKKLGVDAESCVLFDDSVPGLQAGSKGNFGLVIGVSRRENRKLLSENGADLVIDNFDELDLINDPDIKTWFNQSIPPFASQYVEIGKAVYNKTPVLFLDYDGTLTSIVQHPEAAVISKEMYEVLNECAAKFKVAAVSGRDMDDLKSRIKLENMIYAGSHGFRISGPDGLYMEHDKSEEILPVLDKMEKKLNQVFLNSIEGLQIERKRYAIAIHYRNSREKDIPYIKNMVYETTKNSEGFKVGEGKKILEIKPDINWHKGKAVLWILDKLGLTDPNKFIPIYIGDDVTDEDAYKALKGRGIGIQVGPGAATTAAQYRFKNVYQVRIFLKELANYLA